MDGAGTQAPAGSRNVIEGIRTCGTPRSRWSQAAVRTGDRPVTDLIVEVGSEGRIEPSRRSRQWRGPAASQAQPPARARQRSPVAKIVAIPGESLDAFSIGGRWRRHGRRSPVFEGVHNMEQQQNE